MRIVVENLLLSCLSLESQDLQKGVLYFLSYSSPPYEEFQGAQLAGTP